MTIQERILTVEEFEAFTELPENVDSLFEFIGGELVEVPSNPQVSKLATRVSVYIGMYLLKNNIAFLIVRSYINTNMIEVRLFKTFGSLFFLCNSYM